MKLKRAPSKANRWERAQALIEFALLSPLAIMFIAAIVVFGLALNTRSSLQQAVREGARQASVGATLAQVQDLAAGNAPDALVPADVLVCHPVGTSGTQGQIGDPVRVYIYKGGAEGYPYTLVSVGGIFNALGLGSLAVRMSPRATARLEKSVLTPVDCPP
jgi:TadE-like protein